VPGSVPRPRLSAAIVVLGLLVAAPSASALDEQAAPAAATTAPTVFSTSRVIVQWAPGADHSDKVEARDDADVTFKTDLGSRDFQLVKVDPGQTPAEAVQQFEGDPAVAVAEPDGLRSLDGLPNDPLFNQLWGLRNLGGAGIDGFSGAVAGDDVAATAAWDRTIGSPSTVIADIDSGYRFNDPDLGPVAWTNPGEIAGNGIDDDANGYVDDTRGYDFVGDSADFPSSDNDPTDDNLISGGHGLHTAGTMGAAGDNSVGIAGVARNVRIMPLRVCANQAASNEARCPFDSILAAINYAGAMGARVANMSLGGNTFTQTEVNAIAAHPQTLYVISAGNDSGDNDGGGAAPKGHHYPCDYRPTVDASPAVPGAIDNIVCVAATDQADGLASFSDWGLTSVDLGAPGTSTLSTYAGQETPIEDDFQSNDFSTRWTVGGAGFGRAASGDGPLTSFGMTDSPGATPAANSVYEATLTTAAPIPAGAGACQIRGRRLRRGGSFSYGLSVGGVKTTFSSGETVGSSMVPFNTIPIKDLEGESVQMFFRYTASASPTSADGVWLDDLVLNCYAPLSAPLSYEFLQGTSMAAPHVTGAAGLLFSLKPSASVTEVRNALLTSVDPVASLSGKSTTGGRLDVAAALKKLVPIGSETVAPDTAITSGPASSSEATLASFQFKRTDADAGAFECKLDGGAFAACTSPASFNVAPGSHSLQVRAKVPSGLVDPTPATSAWTVLAAPPVEPGGGGGGAGSGGGSGAAGGAGGAGGGKNDGGGKGCTVPKLAGKTQSQATSALAAAGCTLGKVTKPKAKKGHKLGKLVVKSSTPAAGATSSAAVALTLAPQPKKHHR
jgi:thermitase